jgi:hypothetical protein
MSPSLKEPSRYNRLLFAPDFHSLEQPVRTSGKPRQGRLAAMHRFIHKFNYT